MNKIKNNNKLKFIIPFIIFLASLSYGTYYIYDNYYATKNFTPEVKKIIKENKKVQDKKSTEQNTTVQNTETYTNTLPNYRQQYNNSYITGKLTIPGVKIDSLVTRASNNIYYLNHDIYNNYNFLGTPFFDYRNTNLVTDRQINIYGHNTEIEKYYNSLPFTNLESYNDYNVFTNVKDITLDIDEKRLHFNVIAVKIINNSDNEHMKLVFYSDDDFLNHINKLLNNTVYKDNVSITASDRILVLQACHFNPKGTYILIIAKEVK